MCRAFLPASVLCFVALSAPAYAANNNGTLTGNPLFSAGLFGNAATFEYGRYAVLPDFSASLGNSYTEVLWFKRSSIPLGIEVLTASGGTGGFQSSWVGIQTTGHLVYQGYGSSQVDSGVTVTDGAWHQVMVVYTPSAVTAYIDHNLGGVSGPSNGTFSGTAAIGGFGNGNFPTAAQIDEVAWFTGDRHAVESSVPTAPYANSTPNLIALYHLENDATDSAASNVGVPLAPTPPPIVTPTVTVTPASFPLGVATSFTLANSGTDWTALTRPTVSGGNGAYLSNMVVSGQTITATLLPGNTIGMLTLGNSTNSLTANVSAVANLTTVVVLHGDSLTRGYRGSGDNTVNATRLAVAKSGLGPTATLFNEGIGGQTIENMTSVYAATAGADYRSGKVNVLVVQGGHNSWQLGETVAQVMADWRTYFATVKATHPDTLIVWETELPAANPGVYPADFDAKRDQINAWARSSFTMLGVCQLSDVAADAVIGQDGQEYNLLNFNDDFTHPTDLGYTRMGNADLQAIRAALRGCVATGGQ